MSRQPGWVEFEQACREVGLPVETLDRLRDRLFRVPEGAPPDVTSREAELMELIGTKSVDRLVHDVRNLLNEIALLRAVAALDEEK